MSPGNLPNGNLLRYGQARPAKTITIPMTISVFCTSKTNLGQSKHAIVGKIGAAAEFFRDLRAAE